MTITAWPATVTVPDRWLPVVLTATEMVTVPLPVPVAPAVTVIQFAPLDAAHVQPPGAVTFTA